MINDSEEPKKLCKTCEEEKPLSQMCKNKNCKSGYKPQCKKCARNFNTKYYNDHWDKRRDSGRISTHNNRDNNGGDIFSVKDWEDLKYEYDNCCAYCNKPSEFLTIDHIIPKSKGGTNEKSNIAPACKFCNGSKNNKDLKEWLDGDYIDQDEAEMWYEALNMDDICEALRGR